MVMVGSQWSMIFTHVSAKSWLTFLPIQMLTYYFCAEKLTSWEMQSDERESLDSFGWYHMRDSRNYYAQRILSFMSLELIGGLLWDLEYEPMQSHPPRPYPEGQEYLYAQEDKKEEWEPWHPSYYNNVKSLYLRCGWNVEPATKLMEELRREQDCPTIFSWWCGSRKSLWLRLEEARQAAMAKFDGETFAREIAMRIREVELRRKGSR